MTFISYLFLWLPIGTVDETSKIMNTTKGAYKSSRWPSWTFGSRHQATRDYFRNITSFLCTLIERNRPWDNIMLMFGKILPNWTQILNLHSKAISYQRYFSPPLLYENSLNFICVMDRVCVCLSACLSGYLSGFVFVCLCVYLCVYPSVSVFLHVYVSVCLCVRACLCVGFVLST